MKHLRVLLESLRQSSEILGKCSGSFVWPSEQFWKIFGNLRSVVENLRKNVKNAVISKFIYYMASSASGQDDTKSRAVIGYPSGQDGAILPAQDYLVQSLNSPFFPPHIGAEPGRAKEESRITCMRILRTN